jgi:hypothetical protein
MSKHVIVLGTVHQLQGAEKDQRAIIDPTYRQILETKIEQDKIDFVFEESNPDEGSTIAEKTCRKELGDGRYALIDPSRDQRTSLGIGKTVDCCCWNPMDDTVEAKDWICELYPEEHKKREAHWIEMIQKVKFDRGLLICGHAHLLSISFRLQSQNYSVESHSYMPYHRLCERQHSRT